MNNINLINAIMEIANAMLETEECKNNQELSLNIERIKENCINFIDIIDENKQKLIKTHVLVNTKKLYNSFLKEMKHKQYECTFLIKEKNGHFVTEIDDDPAFLGIFRYPAIFPTRKMAKKYLKEHNADENKYEIIECQKLDKMKSFIFCEYI